jgi:chemotaxis-related protein WspD
VNEPAANSPLPGPPCGPAAELEACWTTKGVYGNGECPTLQQQVHCRNCPEYSRAGLQLLNRPLPPDYRRECTERFACGRQPAAPGKSSIVIFRLGREWLALPADVFQEVAERQRVHSLPHRLGLVLGLVNIRGELLVCVSVARFLGVEDAAAPQSLPARDRLLVANWSGHRFVFPADEVHGVHRLFAPEIKPPPMTVARTSPACTRGVFLWRQRPVGLLDANLLFSALNRSLS